MAGTVDKKIAAQVTRHVADSFKRLRDAGMPARVVATAFGPGVLAMVVKNGGPQNARAFLSLIRTDVAAEAQQEAKHSTGALPAPQPTPPITGMLDDLRNLNKYVRESVHQVVDLGFDPSIVLLAFGQYATQMVIESEGYDAALAWLDNLSGMIDIPLR